MPLSIATWNINSVRLRIELVARLAAELQPDVICLQETKTPDDRFPLKDAARFGYPHAAIHGQKGYHGVAILSKRPFESVSRQGFCDMGDARHISVVLGEEAGLAAPLTVHNFYIPAGGDIPDPELNPKFKHKLAFLDEATQWETLHPTAPGARSVLVGDLNIAPLETDVWSHKQLLDVVSHTPIEVERFGRLQAAGGWVDVMRNFVPPEEKLYTWWSYRAADWAASNRGRRLDHVWASPALAPTATAMTVLRDARGWERPSDHIPVMVTFDA
ncbi:exodeoxyribonuclease III [Ancylobacter defluvii]|uniref:exodeoxyribonuclease III n=1 Tax=Ancylobacter defluvii TaxID=1282440 RepID=UPI001BD0DC64|nr:exodeoxyribonuclease III [Ancylobacter defluvii]MBS7587099.1 exodeoxyribonuclease III [Ancylobacter defluvii]